ncbi:hypothetical protein T12_3937 [Trichinella patagoniensis]|uniref:Uncharacterized protein n=1 Tax=Trichinella patagoniensis TaxID=990121 RepID=A0A0V0Z476_9BILA|nr:hypothetical protein T12_1377 [Trichinella patagoniensis]KRY07695.1 hypothetical protein T12_1103 [Trichinella patagoniensis]KRY15234.1 hypothetical protein T12_3937 [Trichinella patagoniensis]
MIVPEEDVPEGNKEALEKREETSTSGVEKSQVSLPRCSGQRGFPNVVKHHSTFSLAARPLVDCVVGQVPRPPLRACLRRRFRPAFVEVLLHD